MVYLGWLSPPSNPDSLDQDESRVIKLPAHEATKTHQLNICLAFLAFYTSGVPVTINQLQWIPASFVAYAGVFFLAIRASDHQDMPSVTGHH